MGTAVLLQACRKLRRLQCVLVVTSDKVYENDGGDRPFEEGDRLGGHDPVQQQQGLRGAADGQLSRQFLSRRAAARDRPGGQRHRRRRLVAATGWCPTACGRWRRTNAVTSALPGGGAALAARARAAVGLSRPGAGAGAIAAFGAACCQFRPGRGILLHGEHGGRGVQRALRRQTRMAAGRRRASARGARPDAVVAIWPAANSVGVRGWTCRMRCLGLPTGIGRIGRGRTCWRFARTRSGATVIS